MDHISKLPDDVLCHILSFLKTKQAALTLVLSKRWLNLWTLVPKLVIHDSIFLHPEEGKGKRLEIRQSFMDFVDRALALQGDSPIREFSLKCKNGVDTARVNRWICNVLQRGVSELTLNLPRVGSEYVLPTEVFENKTLVELKLVGDSVKRWCYGTRTFLPMLKALYMSSDRIVLHTQLEMFLHAFPVLEVLYMFLVEWGNSDETVSSASLKMLTMYAVLSLCCESMPVFNNFKVLRIKSDKEHGWQAMPVLLKNCPHIEALLLEGLVHYVTDKCGDACDCISREEDKGRSLKSCPVKILVIQGFKGTMRELTLIKHFLDYFPCLENMEIYPEKNDPTNFEDPGMLERAVEILKVYSESSSCEVSFRNPR